METTKIHPKLFTLSEIKKDEDYYISILMDNDEQAVSVDEDLRAMIHLSHYYKPLDGFVTFFITLLGKNKRYAIRVHRDDDTIEAVKRLDDGQISHININFQKENQEVVPVGKAHPLTR